MINFRIIFSQSPAVFAGLLFCLLVTGCLTSQTPEQVTLNFWSALAKNDLANAKRYATQNSRELIGSSIPPLDSAAIETGRIIIDGDKATVETLIHTSPLGSPPNTDVFLTVLAKEDGQWQVDYRQTLNNLPKDPFNRFFKSLENLGERLNQQLERQLPKLEQGIESFGNELEKQIDQFGNELEKAFPPTQNDQGKSI